MKEFFTPPQKKCQEISTPLKQVSRYSDPLTSQPPPTAALEMTNFLTRLKEKFIKSILQLFPTLFLLDQYSFERA